MQIRGLLGGGGGKQDFTPICFSIQQALSWRVGSVCLQAGACLASCNPTQTRGQAGHKERSGQTAEQKQRLGGEAWRGLRGWQKKENNSGLGCGQARWANLQGKPDNPDTPPSVPGLRPLWHTSTAKRVSRGDPDGQAPVGGHACLSSPWGTSWNWVRNSGPGRRPQRTQGGSGRSRLVRGGDNDTDTCPASSPVTGHRQ